MVRGVTEERLDLELSTGRHAELVSELTSLVAATHCGNRCTGG
jgi:hypothetical protein